MITSAERVIEVNNASPQESANRAYGLAEGASNTKSTNSVGVPSTQSSVVLRIATLHDLASLQHIEQTCFTTDRLSKSRFKFYIDAQHAELIVAEREPSTSSSNLDKNKPSVNSIVGYGLLLLRRGTQLTRLYSIAVLPEARGLGVAEKLINSLGERALLRGKRFMRLEVAVGNACLL
ncbi:GNAT family N-acetyltransferase, partial [Alteromonas sp. MCA-1]|uniref:GNAT family N-acetyltransferase n=1 Tax=Alteromonas sp. MCA-1 TaxID=2917731 RepID=UPI001EF7F62F